MPLKRISKETKEEFLSLHILRFVLAKLRLLIQNMAQFYFICSLFLYRLAFHLPICKVKLLYAIDKNLNSPNRNEQTREICFNHLPSRTQFIAIRRLLGLYPLCFCTYLRH